ncbi:hypothetical protein GGI15_004044 [Coemansia interrupta]|uniref:Protein kinase domain-containing protein n=1 Tax=Coemansia interrupta TaxID=1126814 RepID=A0A9W8H564_9FUNG|nr:hypothetical protein GGI15_004044 [Coemansia interrupta]
MQSPQQTQGTDASTGADTDTDIDPMTQAEDSCASSSTRVPQRPCRRHRRNSDAFIDNKMLAMHHTAFDEDEENDGNNSDDERSSVASDCSRNSVDCLALSRTPTHHHGMVSDTEDGRRIPGRRGADHMPSSHAAGRTSESPGNRKLHQQQRFHHSARRLRAAASVHRHSSMKGTVSRALQETIRGNSQEEPMSSVKALRIFNTLFPTAAVAPHESSDETETSEHDPACKQCVSEAMVAAHRAAAGGVQHGDAAHSELRMNLGAGRNAVYVAPCERHLECPLEKKGKYLIHTNKPKIMTDLSKVDFGICVDGWRRVVFKTVNDPALAQRELAFHRRVTESQPGHVLRLLDAFEDNSAKHVMVFPRMCAAELFGRDLSVVAVQVRQLFTALDELHKLGIAHLDITPTNLMADPNDKAHIEIIDLGLACDLGSDGVLPSRGTCGFVAPEVLHGGARDLRADVYSAGVVLGMMLQRFLPTVSLRLLGGPLVRSDTTDAIVSELDNLLDAYGYVPAAAEFVERNAPKASAASMTRDQCTRTQPARCSRSYVDDDAAAFAAAYVGCSSIYGGYGASDDDDELTSAPRSVSPGAHLLNGTSSPSNGHSAVRYMVSSSDAHSIQRPGRVPAAVLHAADLLRWALQADPQRRPTAVQALHHPFLASVDVPKRVPRRWISNAQIQQQQQRPDSGFLCTGDTVQQLPTPPPLARGHSAAVPGSGDGDSCSSSGGNSSSAMASDRTSPLHMMLATPPPTISSGLSGLTQSPTLTYSAVAGSLFKDTALADVAQWEGEMYNRLAPASSHGESRHADIVGKAYSMDYAGSDTDCLASFYAPSSYGDDLTSYFY